MRVERWSEGPPPAAQELRKRLESEGYHVSQWSDSPGTVYGAHTHREDQSHWIVSGELEVQVDGETYVLHAGDRDYLPANTPHAAFVPGRAAVVYLIGAKD
jgi:quercetin dioxygenase-like cupin family protein